MEKKKEKILRFKDGFNERYLGSRDDRENNKAAHGKFQKCFLNRDRRVTLVVLGTRHKKEKNIRTSVEKAILESIMRSSVEIRNDGGKQCYPTVPIVRIECHDEDIQNAAYDGLSPGMVINANLRDFTDKDFADGKRLRDCKKITYYEKGILTLAYYGTAAIKKSITIGEVLAVIVGLINILKIILEIEQQVYQGISRVVPPIILIALIVIFKGLAKYSKNTLARKKERIQELSEQPYPVIFYNGGEKLKNWMRYYIQCYEKSSPQDSFHFYIGPGNLKGKKVTAFIVPDKYPEWGEVCLCQLVRELSGHPWNDICQEDCGFAESWEIENLFVEDMQKKYILPDEYELLQTQLKKIKRCGWNYAKVDGEKSGSILFPIEDSLYLLLLDDLKDKEPVETKIKSKIQEISKAIPRLLFWSITADTKEEVFDGFNWLKESLNGAYTFDILQEKWAEIVRLLESIQANIASYKKLYDFAGSIWQKKWEEKLLIRILDDFYKHARSYEVPSEDRALTRVRKNRMHH